MLLFTDKSTRINNYFTILLALLPISFIAGNLIVNLNIILIVISSFLIFKKDLFKIEFFLLDKLIFSFFFLVIFTGLINDILFLTKLYWTENYYVAKKSILFLKYFLLYFAIRYLIEKEIVKLKFFFITCSLGALFVSLDIFYQFIFGEDIFGYKILSDTRKLGGPFGTELIAGGYIQRFSLFSFFLLPIFFKEKTQKNIKYILPILFLVFFVGIILSGNRMPLVLFIFCIILIFIFQKEVRKYILSFIIIVPIIFIFVFNINDKVKINFLSFYGQLSKITTVTLKGDFEYQKLPPYFKEFATFYETWRLNKYIGGGIKSFRYYCHLRENKKKVNSKFFCNMHPHNYYLEILTDTGLIGLLIMSCIFLNTLYLSFYKKYFLSSKLSSNNIITPFIFLFFIEVFPLKSSGSFFTTGNSTYFFLILAILIGIIRKEQNLIENKL